jgi:hypothetical protein
MRVVRRKSFAPFEVVNGNKKNRLHPASGSTYSLAIKIKNLFSSITGGHIKYNCTCKHSGSDDILDGYVPAQEVHAVRQ